MPACFPASSREVGKQAERLSVSDLSFFPDLIPPIRESIRASITRFPCQSIVRREIGMIFLKINGRKFVISIKINTFAM